MKKWGFLFLFAILTAPSAHAFKVAIFFGYMDQTPDDRVEDNREKNYLRELLARPCAPNQEFEELCGFEIRYGDVVVAKKISRKGFPLELTLYSSSVSGIDSVNRTTLKEKQELRSKQIVNEFWGSFYQNTVVFYAGHARYGGGPDFSMPRLKANGQIDKAFYQTKFTGEQDVLKFFKDEMPKVKIVGWYACDSKWHFEKDLKDALPNAQLRFVGKPLKPRDITRALAHDLNQIL